MRAVDNGESDRGRENIGSQRRERVSGREREGEKKKERERIEGGREREGVAPPTYRPFSRSNS